jgi:pimeloyl-ACP methyl ester carboxylesterase
MGSFPSDFPVPIDEGGPGEGHPVGGFGGNPTVDRPGHRAVVQRVGKAPVLLIHGNAAAADTTEWNLLDLKNMLNGAGYPDELIWAPSYLGAGVQDNELPFARPHTNNVNEVRAFVDRVCDYLDVHVVDVVAHSLGCSLVYAICRGLEKRQPPPVNFNQPKRWPRVGTFVALAGAFHGLGPGLGTGEWVPGGEFMTELLAETEGGGGETPYRTGQASTPAPAPHQITYFCGIASGDFVDASRPGTGRLTGAVNRDYSLGASFLGHRQIKESPVVFADFLPLLNTVPPAPPANLTVQPGSGSQANPLTATVAVTPASLAVELAATQVTKAVRNGALTVTAIDSRHQTLHDGDTITLSTDGQWELTFSAPGAVDDVTRTYWVGIPAVDATITTSNTTPFQTSLTVTATSSNPRASLYHSLGGGLWNEGANVSITDDAVVSFIAIDPSGVTSEIVSQAFRKAVLAQAQVTATVNEHFIAGRIDVTEFLTYLRQFGLAPFTLFLVNGDWVLDPRQPIPARTAPEPAVSHDSGTFSNPITLTLSADDEVDPNPRIYYTTDGSDPTTDSPSFAGSGRIRLAGSESRTVKYFARNSSGQHSAIQTRTYDMDGADDGPVIAIRSGDPQPGEHTAPVVFTIEGTDRADHNVTVFYTQDGSLPDEQSPSFRDHEQFELSTPGNHVIACYAADSAGNQSYEMFYYSIRS